MTLDYSLDFKNIDFRKHSSSIALERASKFLQMEYTWSRRYANHKSGRKYSEYYPQNMHQPDSSCRLWMNYTQAQVFFVSVKITIIM